jgi:hypothetical protein
MASSKPIEELQKIFKDLYKPEFLPKDIDLKAFYDMATKEAEEDIERSYANTRRLSELGGLAAVKRPITAEEAEVIENHKGELLAKAKRLRDMLAGQFEHIDKEAGAAQGGVGWSHTFELKGRPRLRKAIKRVFGDKKSTITYSEYRELLKRKKMMEMVEASDLMKEESSDEEESGGIVSGIIEDLI